MIIDALKSNWGNVAIVLSGIALLGTSPSLAASKAWGAFVAVTAALTLIEVVCFTMLKIATSRRLACHPTTSLSSLLCRGAIALLLVALTYIVNPLVGLVVLISGICVGVIIFLIAIWSNSDQQPDPLDSN